MNRYGLIGLPLGHSFSAGWFAEKFRREGIADSSYENFPLRSIEELPSLLSDNPELKGLNVTIPYKEKVIPFLDRLDPVAREIGAVNCIRVEQDGSTTGFNTDAWGFEHSILPFLENKFERALILGTGGASRAIQWVLERRGITCWYLTTGERSGRRMNYEDLDAHGIGHFLLIIQCTPLGTYPDVASRPPLPYDGLTANHFLYDLVYNPPLTAFLEEGVKRGARVMNGLAMLEGQAARSWEIWRHAKI